MRKVTWQYDVENGENVQVYRPYAGAYLPALSGTMEGYTWGRTSYDWTREHPAQAYVKPNGHNGHVRY